MTTKKKPTTTLRYVSPLPEGHPFADPADLLAYLDRCERGARRRGELEEGEPGADCEDGSCRW